MAGSKKLTAKEQRFIDAYLGNPERNATKAAIEAGYSKHTAGVMGSRLLKKVHIRARIAPKAAKAAAQAELSAVRVLEELRRLSFSSPKSLFDENGNLKPIHLLSDDEAACIASFEVIKKNAEAGDGKIDVVHKLKVWDKTRSLEMLAKHFALLTDVVKLTTDEENIAKLLAGRKRAAEASRAR